MALGSPNISPTTKAQLRDALARLGNLDNALQADIVSLAARITILENFNGLYAITFDDAAELGQPVYTLDVSGPRAKLADATLLSTARVVGVCAADVADDASGFIINRGRITKADWTNVAGSTSLTPHVPYYLGTSPGTITPTAPDSGNEANVFLGYALSTTTLDFNPSEPIGL